MRYLGKAGTLLFLAAFFYFLSLPFTATYKLDEQNARAQFADRFELVSSGSPELIGIEYKSKTAFLSALNNAAETSAASAVDQFGLSPAHLDIIVGLCKDETNCTYSVDAAAALFEADGATGQSRAKAIKDYTGWLDGQQMSTSDLRDQLQSKADEINAGIKGIELNSQTKFELLRAATQSPARRHSGRTLLLTFGLAIVGALMVILPKSRALPGIKNDRIWFDPLNSRGWIGILLGSFLILFYIIIYWWPHWMVEWAALSDPIAVPLSGHAASQWFMYGLIYTVAVVVMGIRYLIKYRHNRYQQIRTYSVMFFQVAFAFILTNLMELFHLPSADLKNIWPLDYSFFFDYRIAKLVESGAFGYWLLGWGLLLIILGVPIFTYFFGKRWYCSWVCGCGGLAETAGDPFRQQSDKSLKAWQIERYLIHTVLVLAVIMTASVLYTTWFEIKLGESGRYLLGVNSYDVRHWYGFGISSIFAGVVGTGFYPLMGNRVWCRFGCPLSAYLGFVQRFRSRFRITTNGGQCISCGNCSTYCEQGIDVRWYAQRGQNIIRSSCVGCGVCSAVCPRGVLNLESGTEQGRFEMQNPFDLSDMPKVPQTEKAD